ncbi:MAG: hypothetical protein CMK38_00170 [Porticoccaceae bacterium]|jgi:hypothetical protein|nr:hypothetical protein [Porticoccaceae bacterium]|tara:strand:+ start:100 stop:528 length:429 start_codon:yes stop_codon:yes gene_type:complete
MKFVLATFAVSFFLIAPDAFGQQMGAGKLTDTEAEFQKLAAQCDEVEVLMLRARIRLEVSTLESRAETEAAANQAKESLANGMSTCGSGDIEGAKAILNAAYEAAQAENSRKFGQVGVGNDIETEQVENRTESDSKPWWKIW